MVQAEALQRRGQLAVGRAWTMAGDPAERAGWGRDRNLVSNRNSSNVEDALDPAQPVVTAEVAGVAADLESSVVDAAVQRAAAAAVAPLRLMAVHAHPDDESSKGAAALAKYAAEGAGVVVVSCTGGERGDVLNPNIQVEGTDIPALRIEEMARAAEILGVAHVWLGFHDSGYHEGPPESWELPAGSFGALDPDEEIAALVKVVREYRPHVMTTYDENGGYPHPDHIRCHVVSVGAFEAAGDPDAYPDAGEPWQPLKLYYNVGFSRERIEAINSAVKERTGDGPYDEWIKRFAENKRPDPGTRTTTKVPVADFFTARDAALKAHATQIDPDSHWFAVPHELEAEVWGTDDFELARSLVDTPLPEDDLFAGVRERVSS
jgi:mycothiol S-conjugate amidase